MRILFVGCVESSYILLKALLDNSKNVVGVITNENTGFNSDYYDLVPLCEEHDVRHIFVKNINDFDAIEFAKEAKADICYCFGWSQLIHQDFLQLFSLGAVGFHPAELPYNRGRHPLIWALALGLEETASTFFKMDLGADTGDIISQKKIIIDYEDNARTLYDKVMKTATEQVLDFTARIENGNIQTFKQLPNVGNSWRKRGRLDGQIDWRMSSRAIYNLVRSLTHPYVGAHFKYKDKEYKVWNVKEIFTEQYKNLEPGKILSVNEDGSVDIKTYDNIIRLLDFDKVMLNEGEYL